MSSLPNDSNQKSQPNVQIKQENSNVPFNYNTSLLHQDFGSTLLNLNLSLKRHNNSFIWQCSLQNDSHNAILSLESLNHIKMLSMAYSQSDNS